MVYVRLIREESKKTTCETLNLYHGTWQGVGIDRIVLSTDCITSTRGYRVTQEDFEQLYLQKTNRAIEVVSKRQVEEERKKELEEINFWKVEIEGRSFIHQIIALWKLRKRTAGGDRV